MNKYILLIIVFVSTLFSCTPSEEAVNSRQVALKFSFKNVNVLLPVQSRSAENIAKDSTVRVLVYQRAGSSADLSTDTYMGEGTYVVKADGSLQVCTTNDNGNKTSDTGIDISLRSGTYDFYAITPALKVTRAGGATISVSNGRDYATSLTENVVINGSESTQTVALTTLDRKCAQLVFNIDRGAEVVTSVAIDELSLTGLATSPTIGNLGDNLPTTDHLGSISLGSSAFTADATNAWKASGSVVVLPKSSATYTLNLTARFNGSSTPRAMTVTMPAIAFEKGTQYTYALQLYGDKIVLNLTSVSSDSWNIPTNLTADGIGDGTLKNLSMNSSGVIETANCYIVNTANQGYKFKANVMGNGAITPSSIYGDQIAPAIVPSSLSPVFAFVLWETGSKGDVIQDGSVKLISKDYVAFKTANNSINGNAVIGVTDVNGKLLWSWHIWKTSYAPNLNDASTYDTYVTRTISQSGYSVISSRSFKMMKYNLGATANDNTASNAGDLGLLYQWGRKDPFLGASGWTTAAPISSTNANGYEWYDSYINAAIPSNSTTVEGYSGADASIKYAIYHPTHYIVTSLASIGDWLNVTTVTEQRDNLWGNPNTTSVIPNTEAGSKSIYDPCPPGWRVPRQDSFTRFTLTGIYTTNNSKLNVYNSTSTYGTDRGWYAYYAADLSGSYSYLPTSGGRLSGSGNLMYVSTNGYFWNASSYHQETRSYAGFLAFGADFIDPLVYGDRAHALSVRCAQEE
ncbi:BF2992 family fimbrillin-A clan protein [uncultured Bacteroides sp.]|uniref:BF2992 family fimbrillin-A clan protein n=1 Tax=uncultured Bacteroides sp. TaxID=162156 RepID=UPI002AAB777B|nr:hypothetical protein [uncultured Bacteroides sp.]